MEDLKVFYLQIADNALILSHRLSEYSSHGPFLEEDLANSNVALDLIGTAESIYIRLAEMEGISNYNDYAYKRSEKDFLNVCLVEQPNVDFAYLMVRQFFMDSFHFYFFSELCKSKDKFLNDVALKTLKEVTYHLRRSSEWMIRLGDGTPEANQRTQHAIDDLWTFTNELFYSSPVDLILLGKEIAPDLNLVRFHWLQKVKEISYFSHLSLPESETIISSGKSGVHSEYMGHILAEMQSLTVRYPDSVW